MQRLLASTLAQLVVILLGSMLTASLLVTTLVYLQNAQAGAPWPWEAAHRIISLVNLLERVPEHRLRSVSLLEAAQRPNLTVAVGSGPPACSGRSIDAAVLDAALRTELGHLPGMRVATCAQDSRATNIQVLIPLGRHVVEIRTGTEGVRQFRASSPAFGALLFLLICTLAMSGWTIWRVIQPLRRLSERVEQFSRDISPAPIVEEGPSEIRNVASALNQMQQRITGMVEQRTRTLAAISHDLRTPLTRMRLQLETPQDVDLAKLRRNVELMQSMLASALSLLDGGHSREAPEWIDLDALLATLCDEYEETGARISYHGPGHIRCHCRPDALQRALGNLIDNALQHGQSVAVHATTDADTIRIEVIDDGPGIPAEQVANVLKPFVRIDGERPARPGSVGLGLSIVEEIVRVHDGTLSLCNRPDGGLVARIELPLRAPWPARQPDT